MFITALGCTLILLLMASAWVKNIKQVAAINTIGMAIIICWVMGIAQIVNVNTQLSAFQNYIYVDSLSVIQLIIISTVAFVAALYAQHMIIHELKIGIIGERKARSFFLLFQCFIGAMLLVAVSNHLLLMWIGLEATTLSTAFLIGFYHHKLAIEAAWKYIILCSIGISIGLVGIIVFLYAAKNPENHFAFQWTYLVHSAGTLDPGRIKLAFALIFVGIGTKAGFAPMHTWLADAYSEAPTPSAIMSGVLTNLALYVILRFYAIVRLVPGVEKMNMLFLCFGALSLFVAVMSLFCQSNGKRLLAYSSVENMGIMSMGIGFGGPVALFGVLLHSIAHTYAKAMLFLAMGNYQQVTGTKRIDKLSGLRHYMPITSALFIIGLFVATGFPPAAVFFSELSILNAGLSGQYYGWVGFLLLMLFLAFAGMLKAFAPVLLGTLNLPKQQNDESGADAAANAEVMQTMKENLFFEKGATTLPIFVALFLLIGVSVAHFEVLMRLLTRAANVIMG